MSRRFVVVVTVREIRALARVVDASDEETAIAVARRLYEFEHARVPGDRAIEHAVALPVEET